MATSRSGQASTWPSCLLSPQGTQALPPGQGRQSTTQAGKCPLESVPLLWGWAESGWGPCAQRGAVGQTSRSQSHVERARVGSAHLGALPLDTGHWVSGAPVQGAGKTLLLHVIPHDKKVLLRVTFVRQNQEDRLPSRSAPPSTPRLCAHAVLLKLVRPETVRQQAGPWGLGDF